MQVNYRSMGELFAIWRASLLTFASYYDAVALGREQLDVVSGALFYDFHEYTAPVPRLIVSRLPLMELLGSVTTGAAFVESSMTVNTNLNARQVAAVHLTVTDAGAALVGLRHQPGSQDARVEHVYRVTTGLRPALPPSVADLDVDRLTAPPREGGFDVPQVPRPEVVAGFTTEVRAILEQAGTGPVLPAMLVDVQHGVAELTVAEQQALHLALGVPLEDSPLVANEALTVEVAGALLGQPRRWRFFPRVGRFRSTIGARTMAEASSQLAVRIEQLKRSAVERTPTRRGGR